MPALIMRLLCGLLTVALPSYAAAQTPESPEAAPPREGIAIGVALSPAWIGSPELWPAVRLTLPVVARLAVDVEVGRTLPADNGSFSTDRSYGITFRFLKARRAANGTSRYWMVGPAYVVGTSFDADGQGVDQRQVVPAIKLGYGGDQIFRNGARVAAELGVIGGGSRAPTGVYATLAVQWTVR